MDHVTPHMVEPMTFQFETVTPAAAASLLAARRRGAERQDAVVRAYAEDMAARHWILNGIPIVLSRRGVLLDGMQRLHACVDSGVSFPTFVARNVGDDVEHTIDQHHRRSCASILSARGVPHAHPLMALITRMIAYDHLTLQDAAPPAPSWGQVERLLRANPGLELAVGASMAMAGSPLPEPVRTAILFMGYQVDRAKTDRLLAAVAHPEGFAHGEPGAMLRLELDRAAEVNPQGGGRNVLFALAIKALNALLRDESLRHIGWTARHAAGEPAEPFPRLHGYNGLATPGPEARDIALAEDLVPPGCTATFEVIDQATAARYLAMKIAKRELIKTHVAAMARDIMAGRWMRNAQPICFSKSGRLINGQHRLLAVIASHGAIDVPVVRGLPEAAYATYDTHARRAPPVEDDTGAFGDQALAVAMANLLWRRERRTPSMRGKKATAAEIRQILVEFPRLLSLRGFARRMLAFGRASVMGYGAFVIERDEPQLASVFLKGLETGADLPEGHPILALREQLQRLRREHAPQDDQLVALLAGWARFKARLPARDTINHKLPAEAHDPATNRYARSLQVATASTPPQAPQRTQKIELAEGLAELRRRRQQQALSAGFGAFALRHSDTTALMQEASRVAAEGLSARFSKVLEYQRETDTLLLRAGVGWREGVVGNTLFPPGRSSPARHAFSTGQPTISNDLSADDRFSTPRLLQDHGIKREINVVIGGRGSPFGVLEVDDTRPGTFSETDVRYLEEVANTLGLALERERQAAENEKILVERGSFLSDIRHRVSNGLQLVHSVLSLQAQEADSLSTRAMLERGAMRVITLAAVHQQLYQGEHVDTVEMRGYLAGLVEMLRDGLPNFGNGRSVALVAEAGTYWPAQRAQMLGLILGELLADALGSGEGALRVRFEDKPGGARLELEDEEGIFTGDDGQGAGVGMRMVSALLLEQGAALSVVRSDAGSRVLIAFPPAVAPP
ncbi:sensor histidine kinase [Humitalea sp. 24SJ18S-53]|uniref:sensor histidine kinase n=1 Tax=Humitalea sp. 24SJ18S-53 TaxID=3422307 RepID=UPI003D678D89